MMVLFMVRPEFKAMKKSASFTKSRIKGEPDEVDGAIRRVLQGDVKMLFLDVTPLSLGIENFGGVFTR